MDIESRFEFLDKVGTGSFATVYRARDLELEREVAIKQIHQQYLDDPQQLQRYWQEAQLLASLHHPNIVTIFDIDRERGWLILELMQANLAERMAGRPMDLRALRSALAHCLRALKYLHARGIVHGDVKPTNLMLDARRRVKIGDFGLARRVSDEEGSLLKGTTKYMAPEVVSDEFGEVGPSSDLYSLGFCAYELMCGSNFESLFPGLSAFGRNQQVAWMMWHAAADRRLPEIHRVLEGVPDDLARVIEKLCEKDQSRRYQAADDALAELNISLKPARETEPLGDSVDQEPENERSPEERKRLLLAGGALAVSLILSVALLLMPSGGNSEPNQRSDATIGYVREVRPEENMIVLVDRSGRAAKQAVGERPRIYLSRTREPLLLEELQPGDRLRIEPEQDDSGQTYYSVEAARPVTSQGQLKSVDHRRSRVVVTLEEGEYRGDLPLRVPDRTSILLNGEPAELRDLRAGDRVEVGHLHEIGGRTGRLAVRLEARRPVESAGFLDAVDTDDRRVTIRFGTEEDAPVRQWPVADDCLIREQGAAEDRNTMTLGELQMGDRVRFVRDTTIQKLVVTRSKQQASGILEELHPGAGRVVVSTPDGRRMTFGVRPPDAGTPTDITLSLEPARLTDLRRYDEVDVTYRASGNGTPTAATIDARRAAKYDRRAVIVAVESFDDPRLPSVRSAVRDAQVLQKTFLRRYAVPEERLLMLLDATRSEIEAQMDDLFAGARRQTQIVVYVATHGYRGKDGRIYLAGRDFDSGAIAETGLPLDWLARRLEECPSEDKLLLLDCSHIAGGGSPAPQPATSKMLRTLKTPLRSTAAIASCAEDQHGLYWPEKHQGLFGHFVARGFGGQADRDRDLHVTPQELFDYLKRQMPDVTIRGRSQRPVFFGVKNP